MSRSLSDWLAYQETLHPRTIDLGLDRLARVLATLGWRRPECPVITVGGTNGKGSCVAILESLLMAGNYRVGTFTSPHLIRYNERIRVAEREVADESLVAAFERIEAARGEVSLTFFEFNTLAALLTFEGAALDAIVLEVGLGGRLDAVNAVDADVAIVSSVALDHCEWLGHDVESIGHEKAGIFRAHRPAILGSRVMPTSVASEARRIGAQLLQLGSEYDHRAQGESWEWRCGAHYWEALPMPALFGTAQLDNAASVLTALHCLRDRLPLTRASIDAGLRAVELPGRFQILHVDHGGKTIEWLLDVAHNPAAALTLANNLSAHCGSTRGAARTIAICGMFSDKDVRGVIDAMRPQVDVWVTTALGGPRALASQALAERVREVGGEVVRIEESVTAACSYAAAEARRGDRIVVFGSFYAVGPALDWLQSRRVSER